MIGSLSMSCSTIGAFNGLTNPSSGGFEIFNPSKLVSEKVRFFNPLVISRSSLKATFFSLCFECCVVLGAGHASSTDASFK